MDCAAAQRGHTHTHTGMRVWAQHHHHHRRRRRRRRRRRATGPSGEARVIDAKCPPPRLASSECSNPVSCMAHTQATSPTPKVNSRPFDARHYPPSPLGFPHKVCIVESSERHDTKRVLLPLLPLLIFVCEHVCAYVGHILFGSHLVRCACVRFRYTQQTHTHTPGPGSYKRRDFLCRDASVYTHVGVGCGATYTHTHTHVSVCVCVRCGS